MKYCLLNMMILGTAITMTACSLYEPPDVDAIITPEYFQSAVQGANANVDEWWKNFNDPKLDDIVEQAIQGNVNNQIALQNIKIARTYIDENESFYFPQIGVSYGATRAQFP